MEPVNNMEYVHLVLGLNHVETEVSRNRVNDDQELYLNLGDGTYYSVGTLGSLKKNPSAIGSNKIVTEDGHVLGTIDALEHSFLINVEKSKIRTDRAALLKNNWTWANRRPNPTTGGKRKSRYTRKSKKSRKKSRKSNRRR